MNKQLSIYQHLPVATSFRKKKIVSRIDWKFLMDYCSIFYDHLTCIYFVFVVF